ncbi:hypothetical protein COU76_03720 [Candidatus Peregrinibacteria bacterium CG10_big_fil_rev_8_21_14_0_10_49_10]|nr:MAG: hypothetical protein COU76_03720 [Candidatus Peregrinibacteria bacterium CG10_big_fil_rev_8_21_14_0_10_49_10]
MKRILSLLGVVTAVLFASVVGAFYDEISMLKEELEQWQENNSADFTDVVARLDDFSTPVFRDVNENQWFNPYVASLAEWEIVSGYKDASGNMTGEFKPGNSVTVAEVLKMAMKSAQIDETKCDGTALNPYAQHHWVLAYVTCAEQMGIRLLRPTVLTQLDRPARRAEVLSVIHDAFGTQVLPLYSNYSDTAGHPLEADIAFATINGIVSGDTDAMGNPTGTFRPDDPINRAEAAKIIYESLKSQMLAENIAAL